MTLCEILKKGMLPLRRSAASVPGDILKKAQTSSVVASFVVSSEIVFMSLICLADSHCGYLHFIAKKLSFNYQGSYAHAESVSLVDHVSRAASGAQSFGGTTSGVSARSSLRTPATFSRPSGTPSRSPSFCCCFVRLSPVKALQFRGGSGKRHPVVEIEDPICY